MQIHPKSKSIVCPAAVNPNMSEALIKQHELCQIIPVIEVKKMMAAHWESLYAKERENTPKRLSAYTHTQTHVSLDHRYHIVKWMSQACNVLGWTIPTFFIGVNAMDQYIDQIKHEIDSNELGALAAACLYYGANLLESATDENVYTLERFRQLCPEVGAEHALREAQVHLFDILQGANLARKTPFDFFLLFMARMQVVQPPHSQIFQLMLQREILGVTFDMCLLASICLHTSGRSLICLGSHVVAAVLYKLIEFLCPHYRENADLRNELCIQVFCMPNGWDQLAPYLGAFGPHIREVSHLAWKHPLSRPKRRTSTKQGKQGKPQDWFRHVHPTNFDNYKMSEPCDEFVSLVDIKEPPAPSKCPSKKVQSRRGDSVSEMDHGRTRRKSASQQPPQITNKLDSGTYAAPITPKESTLKMNAPSNRGDISYVNRNVAQENNANRLVCVAQNMYKAPAVSGKYAHTHTHTHEPHTHMSAKQTQRGCNTPSETANAGRRMDVAPHFNTHMKRRDSSVTTPSNANASLPHRYNLRSRRR